jgi:NADH dehydrogenase FAD-containing subunit
MTAVSPPIENVMTLMSVMESLNNLGVNVILGERVMKWPDHPEVLDRRLKTLVTSAGRELTAEMILPCTGQRPHTALMSEFCPQAISPTSGRIRINRNLQIDNSLPGLQVEDLSHMFACGDCAESGAIQAGHTAYWQGQQAAENIVKMIAIREGKAEGPLGEYTPTHPAIKVTLGRVSDLPSVSDGMLSLSGARYHLERRGYTSHR